MKHYNEIQVGMRFISGMIPSIDHRHIMEVVKKNSSSDMLKIKTIKCLGKPEDCPERYGGGNDTYTTTSEYLKNNSKRVYFKWLDTEVAKILYEN